LLQNQKNKHIFIFLISTEILQIGFSNIGNDMARPKKDAKIAEDKVSKDTKQNKKTKEAPVEPVAEVKKRGRKPSVKAEVDTAVVVAEVKKRGRKPAVKAEVDTAVVVNEKKATRNSASKKADATPVAETKKAEVSEKVEKVKTEAPKEVAEAPRFPIAKPSKKEEVEEFKPRVIDPNIRYSDSELAEFESIINTSKYDALDELQMLKDRLDDLTSFDVADDSMIYSMHMAEQGSEAIEKEKTYAQIQRINEYIKKLDEALTRIKDKTYGVCRVCGILIAKERLLAVPVTTLSASYKIHQRCPEDGKDKIEPKLS